MNQKNKALSTLLIISILALGNLLFVSGEALTPTYEQKLNIGYGGSYFLNKGDVIKIEVSCRITPLPPKDGCDLRAFYVYLGNTRYFQGGPVTSVRHEFVAPQTGYYFFGVKYDHYLRITRIAAEYDTKNYTETKITTNNSTSSNYAATSNPGVNAPSKSFFVNPYTGEPNVLIVVGAGASPGEVISANLLANTVVSLTEKDIDPKDLIVFDIEIMPTNTKNLILVGGPVYNSIVNELIWIGASTVDWYSSPGEWEWISDPLAKGFDILIVGTYTTEQPVIEEHLLSSVLSDESPIWYNSKIETPSIVKDYAAKNKIIFDTNYTILKTIRYSNEYYHIVQYDNIIPFCSGTEIISGSGELVTSDNKAYAILKQMAWEESINLLNESDRIILFEITEKSYELSRQISPILKHSNSILEIVEDIKNINILGINFGGIGWSILESEYPYIKPLLQGLEKLNSYLGGWERILKNNYESLGTTIRGMDKLRSGGGLDPNLESSIKSSISNLNSLMDKSSELKDYLSDIREGVKYFGLNNFPVIQEFYNYLGNVINDINTLNNNISKEISKLNEIITKANQREAQLKNSWNSRRGAQEKVYTILGAISLIIIVFLIIIYSAIKRNNKVKEKKKSKKVQENIEVAEELKLRCPKCGKKIKDDWIICPKCLHKLE